MSAFPFKVKAIHDYSSAHDDDLNFSTGQVITVTDEEDSDWYVGEYTDAQGATQDGLFPRNFVEKYEPAAPPRPARSRPKKEPAPPSEPLQPSHQEPAEELESTRQPEPASLNSPLTKHTPSASATTVPKEPPAGAKAEVAKPVPASKGSPPPVVEKPSSFKDRIAAFNKPAAPPIAPKPSAPAATAGGGFIKKPFVAPPPSRDAYVPPPTRDPAPQKVYRREEDPEIAERQAEDAEYAEKAGLVGTSAPEAEEEEPQKQTSLKDRIALLQRQQQEQAARRAELASKEKPPKPPTKRAESHGAVTQEAGRAKDPEDHEEGLMGETAPHEVPETLTSKPPRELKSPVVPPADSTSDGNEADQSGAGETTEDAEGTSTEVDEPDDKAKPFQPIPPPRTSTEGSAGKDLSRNPPEVEGEEEPEEEEEEEDEMDTEERRKHELRTRMAKMSGGMGMAGIFGGGMPIPGPGPKKGKGSGASEASAATSPPPARAPMIPVPGMSKMQSPTGQEEITEERDSSIPGKNEDDEGVESQSSVTVKDLSSASEIPQERPLPPAPPSQQRGAPPPVPSNRPVPPPIESRPAPPPPDAPRRQSDGTESEDEDPAPRRKSSGPKQFNDGAGIPGAPPPIPGLATNVQKPEGPRSPPSTSNKSLDRTRSPPPVPSASPQQADKRTSRVPPMPPGGPQSRPGVGGRPVPPPPPSGAPPSRKGTENSAKDQSGQDDGESDYEGDYDTDIASGAPHKDALKAHARESSFDETTLSEGSSGRNASDAPTMAPPPVPPTQRAVPPPPPPHQVPPNARKSTEATRGAPPPPPPRDVEGRHEEHDEDYDPYRYSGVPPPPIPPTKSKSDQHPVQESDPGIYSMSPQTTVERTSSIPSSSEPTHKHAVPPPLPPQHTAPPLAPPEPRESQDLPRRSLDPPRTSAHAPRRSVDTSRPGDGGVMARDIDLAETSLWWTQPNTPPPAFQNRSDILCEFEESTTSKRGGRTTISRDVYILFPDYSQTIINARYDPKEPSGSSPHTNLEQKHEQPPARPRQDDLEAAQEQLGMPLAAAAASKQGTVVGDGTAHGLVRELLQASSPKALMPIGTRAYGALIYNNMANASVAVHDEIRPGDVITLRNAKFQGKHGAMHAKYSVDVKDHVGIVAEWDGTKKKIRAWEQGRVAGGEKEKESRKVRCESYKVGDLRSGEVKVWRVVGRDWVGWEGESA